MKKMMGWAGLSQRENGRAIPFPGTAGVGRRGLRDECNTVWARQTHSRNPTIIAYYRDYE